MDSRVQRINKELKMYDESLHAERDISGVIHVYRFKTVLASHFVWNGDTYSYSTLQKDHIFSLTTNFKLGSPAADWGLEPLMRYVRSIDGWGQGDEYDEFCRMRETNAAWKKAAHKQELRATAADMRRDFAKATNDIIVQKQ